MKENTTAEPRRHGSWAELETWQDPGSKVSLILSERIRGKPAHSFQIVHRDAMGVNKHVPLSPEGATHNIEDIVFSLVREARKFLESRRGEQQ